MINIIFKPLCNNGYIRILRDNLFFKLDEKSEVLSLLIISF